MTRFRSVRRRAASARFGSWAMGCLVAASMVVAACSSSEETVTGAGASSSGAAAGTGGSAGSGGPSGGADGGTAGSAGYFADFPAAPEIAAGLPDDLAEQFGDSPGGPGGPCLAEPSLEALVPYNWTPLRFDWLAPAEQNVFELRLKVDNQLHDLVVYTTARTYTISENVWEGLRQHSAGYDIEVRVRGARLQQEALTAGPFVGSEGPVHLASVPAPGAVVYWTSSSSTALRGFTIGDTEVSTVISPEIIGDNTNCVSCHTSAPDGELTFFTRDRDDGTRSVDARSVDGNAWAPSTDQVSPTALELLARHKQSAPVLSGTHYSASDAVVLTVMHHDQITGGRAELVWTDLHSDNPDTGWGLIARNDDSRQAATPTWWHDGSTIAYTSAPVVLEGVVSSVTDIEPTMDIHTVPYNNRTGGTSTPLEGASDPSYWEFYPVISPGDQLLAFNRCEPRRVSADHWANSYDEPTSEVYVMPASGGTPVRVEGNDPPACTTQQSPGITNSWPRWAPEAEQDGDRRYYWLVFSSKRRDGLTPQLYVSAVVTIVDGETETIERAYPAVYVTAQVESENNHTPAWDVFQVQPPE